MTANPGDTIEGNVGLNYNDFGTRTANVSVGGPIMENLGFLLNYSHEDSTTPEIWHARGDYGYKVLEGVETNIDQADGTEFGARTGGNLSGKLVFEPDDTLRLAMTFTSLETHDQRAPVMFLTQAERDACFEGNGVFVDAGMMAPWLLGEMECNWDNARDLYSQHDIEHWLRVNPLNLQHLVEDALNDMGFGGMPAMPIPLPVAGPFTLDDGTVLSIEEADPHDGAGLLHSRGRARHQECAGPYFFPGRQAVRKRQCGTVFLHAERRDFPACKRHGILLLRPGQFRYLRRRNSQLLRHVFGRSKHSMGR